MTRELKRPSNLISLDTALSVLMGEALDVIGHDELWAQNKPEDEHILHVHNSATADQILTAFHQFHTGTKRQSIVICTPRISAIANLIAFAALETGFRVFLVALDIGDHVTPEMLRLSQAGVSILNKDSFLEEIALT